jgi:hypothetical protein
MEVGFTNAVKKLHLVQRGDKTFRYFRMTLMCLDIRDNKNESLLIAYFN